jgi:hypothetical protein
MQGHVIKLTEDSGEVRVLGSGDIVTFISQSVAGAKGFEKLTVKCEVSFVVENDTGQAKDIRLLPPGAHFPCLD